MRSATSAVERRRSKPHGWRRPDISASVGQHITNFFGERLRPGQRGSRVSPPIRRVMVSTVAVNQTNVPVFRNASTFSGRKIAPPPVSMISLILRGDITAHRRFEIAKVIPAELFHDLRNGEIGSPDDLSIRRDHGTSEFPRQQFADCALAGSTIADQDEVHARLPTG